MLTDVLLRNLKPALKTKKYFDADGLYIEVSPAGGKWWRLRYTFERRDKRISLGVYPAVSLREARRRGEAAREQLAIGVDPAQARKAERVAIDAATKNTFEAVALAWYAKAYADKAASTSAKVLTRLQTDVLPWLGGMPIAMIKAADIIAVVQRVERRGALHLAARVFNIMQRIMRYADTLELVPRDVSASIDIRLLLPQRPVQHRAALTATADAHGLWCAIDGYAGSFVVRAALLLSAYTFVRPGELRGAVWNEFDLDDGLWTIPAARMKKRKGVTQQDHMVPLAHQALTILRELYPLTGRGQLLFPGERNYKIPISENTINAALRRLGYSKTEMTAHGFRAMARTLLDEVLNYRPDYIEHQLAHAVRDPNGRAYNRTTHLPERREMMQAWADFLMGGS